MRLPTFQVVDGAVDPISTHGDSIKLVGAGFAQPIPGKTLLGRDAIGYLANCIYRTDNADLNLVPLSWTLQFYAHLPTAAVLLSSHEAQVGSGGWWLYMSSGAVYLYRTGYNGRNYYTYLAYQVKFPKGLNIDEPKFYCLVKEANRAKIYINYQLATTINFPANVGAPGFAMFGLTGNKPEGYTVASTLYCNYLRFDHNYVTPVDEFTRFGSETPREVALSLFDPDVVSPQAFDKVHLKRVRNFSPPLTDNDFVNAVGLIPPLTADVGLVYAVAASDLYSASYPAWKAFPGVNYVSTNSVLWASSTAAGNKWLSIRRVDNQPFLINAFRVTDGNLAGYRGLDYTLQGKMNEDAEWTDLYQAVDIPDSPDLSHYFKNIGNFSYSNYRLLFTRYALATKRMAVSLFQLYYVESLSGSKSFELSNNAKEVTLVGHNDETGNYITSVNFSSESYPRTFNIVLNDGTVLSAGEQTVNELGVGFPWGSGGGYLAKTVEGDYYTKPMVFEGFDVEDTGSALNITYNAPSALKFSADGLDSYAIKAAPATEFMKTAANVWTPVPLETKILDTSESVSATVKRLKAGKYLVRGLITVTTPSGATALLTTEAGEVLLQGMGSYAGTLGDSTIQINLVGEITILVDTNVVVKVHTTVATKATLSLTSKVVIKSEHTKINFYKV